MKKVLDIKLLETGIMRFSDEESSVPDEALKDKIRIECNPYLNGQNHAVLVYMSKQEYEGYLELARLTEANP